MKFIVLTLALAFSFNSMATQPVEAAELFKKVGKTLNGEVCTYTIMKMDNWEGQIAFFLNSPSGNFRVELDPKTMEPLYKDVTLKVSGLSLTFTTPAADESDVDTVITLNYGSQNFTALNSAVAVGFNETYNCRF